MPTRLTYDQLFRISEPKRISRSADVKGPPMDIDSYRDAVYYCFNFKSNVTNTTGLRHRGYVKFFRPRSRTPVPLHKLKCMVDCTCPDYRYRWAWANKQKGSGTVGDQSLNQCLNRAPRKTNPRGIPGLCKHILAARAYIYGVLSSFPSQEPDTSEKFDKLLKYAQKRWADFPGAMAKAKEQRFLLRQRAALRNVAGPPPEPEVPAAPGAGPEPPELPPEIELEVPPLEQPPLAIPPGQRGLGFPPQPPPEEPVEEPVLRTPTTPPPSRGKVSARGFPTVAQMRAARYGESQRVFTPNGETTMIRTQDANGLRNALKIVEELEDEAPSTFPDAGGGAELGGDYATPDLPPSEPPVSDSALGADTEGESALTLLRQMRDSLQQLATALAPPPEEGLEGEMGGAGLPGEAAGALPPPEGEEGGEEGAGAEDLGVPDFEGAEGGEGAEEGGEGEGGGEEDEPEEEDEPKDARPVE